MDIYMLTISQTNQNFLHPTFLQCVVELVQPLTRLALQLQWRCQFLKGFKSSSDFHLIRIVISCPHFAVKAQINTEKISLPNSLKMPQNTQDGGAQHTSAL